MSFGPSSWPRVKLGNVLRHVARPLTVEVDGTYREIGIRSHGKGLFHKAPVTGAAIGGKRVFYVEPGDFVLNIVFAWEGAIGVASETERGMIASHRFPCFRAIEDRLDLRYLERFFHTHAGLELLGRVSPGGAGRNRTLNRTSFLQQEIPLPPLPEQQRIVARIDALAVEISAARELRGQCDAMTTALLDSRASALLDLPGKDWRTYALGDLVAIGGRLVDPKLSDYSSLRHVSGENIERGSCRLLPCRSVEADGVTSSNYLFSSDTVLYSKIRPYLRKAAYVDFEGLCSADMYPLVPRSAALTPRFLLRLLVGKHFTEYANGVSGRTRMPKLNREQLFAFRAQIPSQTEQLRIVEELDDLQSAVELLQRSQVAVGIRIQALIPAILDRAFTGAL